MRWKKESYLRNGVFQCIFTVETPWSMKAHAIDSVETLWNSNANTFLLW